MDKFREYVQTNLITSFGHSGLVLVEFTVDKKGRVINTNVLESAGYKQDKEAIRVVNSSSKKWSPGFSYGEPVDMKIVFPVYFP